MAKDKFEPREEDIGASDYRAYFDSSVLRVWHLEGKERTFRIAEVRRLTAEIGAAGSGKREVKRQPLLRLTTVKGEPISLPLALNKTNAKTIAQLYGNNPGKWAGKLITLYPTTTEVGGRTEDCIRVRNQVPAERTRAGKPPAARPAPALPAPEPELEATDYRDVTDDDQEPPPGALETDHLGEESYDAE
jgi:hypothetical protein